MTVRIQPILSELHNHLRILYGERLVSALLFGSQARGEAVSGSDIDVLVVLEGSVQPGTEIVRTGSLVSNLSLKHNVVLSLIFVSSHRFSSEKSPLLLNIHREGIAL